MYENYNDHVYDLLVPKSDTTNLKVVNKDDKGVVEGLTKHKVREKPTPLFNSSSFVLSYVSV